MRCLFRLRTALSSTRPGLSGLSGTARALTSHTITETTRVSPPPAPGDPRKKMMAASAHGGTAAGTPPPPPPLPPPLTVTHMPAFSNATDLTSLFASLGFSRIKGPIKREPESIMRAHATPTPRLLGVSTGKFLISVPHPRDPAEEGDGGAADDDDAKADALQLSPGSYLLMPAGVRHSAWVVGGEAVDLWMGEQEG